jgi:hypothetical protein
VAPLQVASFGHTDPLWLQDNCGTDILFDATTESILVDTDDDWGEFESAEISPGGREAADLLNWDACGSSEGGAKQSIAPSEKKIVKSNGSSLADLLSAPSDVPGDRLTYLDVHENKPLTTVRVKLEEQISNYANSRCPRQGVDDEDWGEFMDAFEDGSLAKG